VSEPIPTSEGGVSLEAGSGEAIRALYHCRVRTYSFSPVAMRAIVYCEVILNCRKYDRRVAARWIAERRPAVTEIFLLL
jgi:hypothetical protein